jgi:chemotaxis protein methyltransferase CheR
MNNNISDTLLSQLSDRISDQMGLVFSEKNWSSFKRGLGSAAEDFGFEDTDSCGRWLLQSPLTKERIQTLACHLTIGETYFFREHRTFDALQHHVLPAIFFSRQAGDRRLRIWSAGCSTGEEPYSIAMLLSRILPDIHKWKLSILATDVNPRSLQRATDGSYSEWSFRSPPEWLKSHYFRQQGKYYEISPRMKRMVSFEALNLAEDVYPSLANGTNAMDIIFCRNVLMYFSRQLQDKIVQQFYHALIDGGWLIVSSSEASSRLFPQFTAINFPGAVFFMKSKERRDIQEQWLLRTPFEAAAPVLQSLQTKSSAPTLPTQPSPAANRPPSASLKPTLSEPMGASDASQNSSSPSSTRFRKDIYEGALALYTQGRYHEVIALLASHPKTSKRGRMGDLLARTYANQGQFDEALEWCDKALGVEMLNPGYHYLRATILQEQAQWDEADKSLRKALFLDPDFVLAYFALGNLNRQQGRLEDAKGYFENVGDLLKAYAPDDVLPESDGITAGRLGEIVHAMLLQI